MSSAPLIDHYNSHENFGSMPSSTANQEEYRQRLLEKIDNGSSSFLDTLEELRQEQRVRLARVEHDYYNQKSSSSVDGLQESLVTSKPPLPKASKQPVFLTEERAQHHIHHRPMSENIVRRHDDEIAFCPNRSSFWK